MLDYSGTYFITSTTRPGYSTTEPYIGKHQLEYYSKKSRERDNSKNFDIYIFLLGKIDQSTEINLKIFAWRIFHNHF